MQSRSRWWGAAALVLGLTWMGDAHASCMAPRGCTLAWVRVETCEAFEPQGHGMVGRYLEVLRKDKQLADARRIRDSYRGARMTGVVVELNHQAMCKQRPLRTDLTATPVGGVRLGEKVLLHAVTADAAAWCARVTARQGTWRVFVVPPCCDGDPGFPCLLRGDSATGGGGGLQ